MRRDYKMPLVVLLLLYAGYVLFTNFTHLEGRRQLEVQVSAVLRNGHNKSTDQLINEILDRAQELGVGVSIDEIYLNMKPDSFGNQVVRATIKFPFEYDMVFFSFTLNRDIEEELTLIPD